MRLSHSTWGMPRIPTDVAVSHCAALGFDGLELTVIPGWTTDAAGLDAAERRRIRTLYDDHRLELCGLSGNTPLLVSDADEHARNMARLHGYLDLAAELQRPGERLTVSTTSGGDPDDWEQVKNVLVDRFGELAEYAECAGVMIGMEPHVGARCTVPSRRFGSPSRSAHPA